LLVIVIRTLGEVLRLHSSIGEPLTSELVGFYVVGALAAAIAALAVATLHFLGRNLLGLIVAVCAILVLLVYKVVAVNSDGVLR
jgi:hypothetical protein